MMHFAKKSELGWLERVRWCGDQELGLGLERIFICLDTT